MRSSPGIPLRAGVSVVFLLLAGLVGYGLAPDMVSAQPSSSLFVAGQRLMLSFGAERRPGLPRQVICVVTMRDGDFVGCRRDAHGPSDDRETWYNLRLIEEVEKRER